MPELPEVETIRKALLNELTGKVIQNIEVREKKQFIGNPKLIIGKKILDLNRKGKVLTLVLDGNNFLSIHLKMTGQILLAEDKDKAVFKNDIPRAGTNRMPVKATRIIIYFTDNSALYFNDLRKFGWIKLTDKMDYSTSVDILSPDFTPEYVEKSMQNSKKPIKTLLLDQDKITGIGNIYANDSLWEAKIHPSRKANTLSEIEFKNLYMAIKKIIDEGIRDKGSSAKDEMYILPDSEKGGYQNHFKVYHRDGQPCIREDGGTIERIKQNGRGTFYCPVCQK